MKTKQGFILSYVRYSETSCIVKILEREDGLTSYFIKNIYLSKNKKKGYLNPLMGIDFSISESRKSPLPFIKNINLSEVGKQLEHHLINHAQMSVMAELVLKVYPYEEVDSSLYNDLVAFCLDIENKNALVYYIYKIIKQSGYGFSISEGIYFNLLEGHFSNLELPNSIGIELSEILKTLEDSSFLKVPLSTQQRRSLLDILMKYCKVHIPEFSEPKSLDIFRDIW